MPELCQLSCGLLAGSAEGCILPPRFEGVKRDFSQGFTTEKPFKGVKGYLIFKSEKLIEWTSDAIKWIRETVADVAGPICGGTGYVKCDADDIEVESMDRRGTDALEFVVNLVYMPSDSTRRAETSAAASMATSIAASASNTMGEVASNCPSESDKPPCDTIGGTSVSSGTQDEARAAASGDGAIVTASDGDKGNSGLYIIVSMCGAALVVLMAMAWYNTVECGLEKKATTSSIDVPIQAVLNPDLGVFGFAELPPPPPL